METHSQWHSIRPWRPTLSLSVREITSVSATFILSSPLGADHDSSLASLGFSVSDEDDQNGDFSNDLRIPIIGDLLSKGIAVKVNGTPWQRVLFKIDEEMDEAVIILFGLMPGRQYDIELGVVPGERSIRGQITTGTGTYSKPNSYPTLHIGSAPGLLSRLPVLYHDITLCACAPEKFENISMWSMSEALPRPSCPFQDRDAIMHALSDDKTNLEVVSSRLDKDSGK